PKFKESEISHHLQQVEQIDADAAHIAARLASGNMALALSLSKRADAYKNYAVHFSSWMRSCFKADVHQILNWVEDIGRLEREKQKDFLFFCSSVIRDSFHLNYLRNEVPNRIFEEIKF